MKYDTHGSRKPIQFKGFKSKLEYIASNWLTIELALETIYEPQTFQTKLGQYTPDFYCPKIKTYFECKPNFAFANLKLYEQFVLEQEKDLVLISPEEIGVIEFCKADGVYEKENWIYNWKDNDSQIGYCSNCATYFFSNVCGSYHCRACGTHEGDHDQKFCFPRNETNKTKESFKYYDLENEDMIDFRLYYLAAINKKINYIGDLHKEY